MAEIDTSNATILETLNDKVDRDFNITFVPFKGL